MAQTMTCLACCRSKTAPGFTTVTIVHLFGAIEYALGYDYKAQRRR
jgi:hypothetical protein